MTESRALTCNRQPNRNNLAWQMVQVETGASAARSGTRLVGPERIVLERDSRSGRAEVLQDANSFTFEKCLIKIPGGTHKSGNTATGSVVDCPRSDRVPGLLACPTYPR